ncbi:tRNA (N6-threonylcarbamoyladenosine(37)-N6)-methyltransferase TrmO [Labrenzia sp. PO1]|uniref:tRNA (N6-threonylcarbamoyladenosine(37)-N6)-methyltransferase TrmO n=1 Tax=Stappiaceae TaxID=2821832 RepID=UPI0012682F27|nr:MULTISPECIES: tRNA (N6-threonylcarbamoyladenosine(37)-N6)-methyltransferase TrmO [Stappiaceae]MCR9283465.1 tRNA (N6-threonylcarbamoyladenosine(37)-N6)-methyltransferase TrmO [Paracoccaceae bacterium]MEC9419737.1 tRNA (N6-threonylcarbamoyladenosine(37)-N6)-methyltransferase TrmO [Pseudomonadota bacterium]NKI59477.1 tRNA (N6-threonylcarbamoyladenosine(37)-N6)-methyltransferase TrmO [Labrenzia sp. PO1]QFS96696.1 S-adenosyl-L-methionine-binding protein [Labrenzia sp. THAF191b]QFT03011.1 S-adeno
MSDIRPHEISVPIQEPDDARLFFIGRIHTPWKDRKDCPRQGKVDGPECRIEIFEPWVPALKGIEEYDKIELLYWLDKARRDLIVQNPAHSDNIFGTFALRSPVRPNPIGTVLAKLVSVDGPNLIVRGLDCLDGTPLIDLKPDRCAFTPKAPPKD